MSVLIACELLRVGPHQNRSFLHVLYYTEQAFIENTKRKQKPLKVQGYQILAVSRGMTSGVEMGPES